MAGLGIAAISYLEQAANKEEYCWGYGIKFDYGSFRQEIDPQTGSQIEIPDFWSQKGTPCWEIPRHDVLYPIRFGGTVESIPIDDKESEGKFS